MPELPEVETIKRGLARSLEGAKIVHVEMRRPDLRYPFPHDLAEKIQFKTITQLARRAKYILIFCENRSIGQELVLISHLGMSGSWRVEEESASLARPQKHDHLVITIVNKDQKLRVTYHDPRRFGFILLTPRADLQQHPMLRDLGVEPLSNDFSQFFLSQCFKGKKTPLKSALLDQRLIAGLGNIYVCEALWQAKLSPFLACGWLATGHESAQMACERLSHAIRDVLMRGCAAGGSTLRDYVHIDGNTGYFQHQFNVYDRENCPCPRCFAPIVRIAQSGRSTFYCAACQPCP